MRASDRASSICLKASTCAWHRHGSLTHLAESVDLGLRVPGLGLGNRVLRLQARCVGSRVQVQAFWMISAWGLMYEVLGTGFRGFRYQTGHANGCSCSRQSWLVGCGIHVLRPT